MPTAFAVPARRVQAELMDRPDLDSEWHYHALDGLARINRWSRAATSLWRPIFRLHQECRHPLRVLDVATGGGDVLCALARRAQRSQLPIEFAGCDVSPRAVEFAARRARQAGLYVDFFAADALNDPFPGHFDIVISTLFLHHLREDQATQLLRKMACTCAKMLIVSDLRRTRRGLWLAHLATRFLTRSPVVRVDGPRSVENAFTTGEIRRMAAQAGLQNVQIENCWPQRFLFCWQKDGAPQ